MQLSKYARNVTSQFGEDGIIEEIFRRIGETDRTCVEFGAWDGQHLSNTWQLWHDKGWGAVLIEGDRARYDALRESLATFPKVRAVHAFVSAGGDDSLGRILARCGFEGKFDLLSIDIDGDDYHVWDAFDAPRARVVVIEFNPTIPPHLDLVQRPGAYFGASAGALVALARRKGYLLAACTSANCIFVTDDEFAKLDTPPLDIEVAFPRSELTYVINSYDGGTFVNRNPSYSQLLPPLSALTLLVQARRTPRNTSKGLTPVEASTGLTAVRMYARDGRTNVKALFTRVATRLWSRLRRSVAP